MDIKTNKKDFDGCIILSSGYCGEIYNFLYYDLNINSDNFYSCGVYGWNWSIYSLNRTLPGLRYNIYTISAYRNSPRKAAYINYERINAYFKKVIANYKKAKEGKTWRECEKLKKIYIPRITKKLNLLIEEDIKNARF